MRWRTVLGVVFAAGLGVAFVRAPGAVVEGPRTRMERALRAIDEQRAVVAREREAAWGETRPGRAFDHYRRASELLRGQDWFRWDRGRGQWMRPVRGEGPRAATAAEVQAARAAWAPALGELALGAHCRDATRSAPVDFTFTVTRFANAELELLLAERRWHAAVALWLDAMTFELDRLDHGGMVRDWGDGELRVLDEPAQELLAAGLERLDARLSRPRDARERLAERARPFVEREFSRLDWHWLEVARAWEHGFDPGEYHLAALDEVVALAARLEPPAGEPSAREAQWAEVLALPRTLPSHVADFALDWARRDEAHQRSALARSRLLRLALAFHRRVPLPTLLDPSTGAPFPCAIEGDRAVFGTAEPAGRGRVRSAQR